MGTQPLDLEGLLKEAHPNKTGSIWIPPEFRFVKIGNSCHALFVPVPGFPASRVNHDELPTAG